MSKTDFLKQAIADATEIQRSSVELAKKSLSEAFDSQLKSMLAAKLQEEADQMDEEIEEEVAHEAYDEKIEEADSDALDSEEAPMEEEYDLDAILAEMDGEDEDEDEEEKEPVDEGKEEDEDTEKQEEHEKEESEEEEAKEEEEVDEELNLEALLRELSMSEEADEEAPEEEEDKAPEEDDEVKKMEEQLFELKNKLNEVNLLNAKLLYLNKVLAENDSLSASQKVKLISTFDEASSVKEVKLVHKTITEAFKVKQGSTKKVTQLKESVKSFASNPAGDSNKMDKTIDTNPLSSLWQKIRKY